MVTTITIIIGLLIVLLWWALSGEDEPADLSNGPIKDIDDIPVLTEFYSNIVVGVEREK